MLSGSHLKGLSDQVVLSATVAVTILNVILILCELELSVYKASLEVIQSLQHTRKRV